MKVTIKEFNDQEEIISEPGLFEAIKKFSESNNVSNSLIGNKFFLMTKNNLEKNEKVISLISKIKSKIEENQEKINKLMINIDYDIAKIRKNMS